MPEADPGRRLDLELEVYKGVLPMSESNQQPETPKPLKRTMWAMTALCLVVGAMGVDRIVDALGADHPGRTFRLVLGIGATVCGTFGLLWNLVWLARWGRR
jgi:hypothetical protein